MLFSKTEKARRKNRWERKMYGGVGDGFQCLDRHLGNSLVGRVSKQ